MAYCSCRIDVEKNQGPNIYFSFFDQKKQPQGNFEEQNQIHIPF